MRTTQTTRPASYWDWDEQEGRIYVSSHIYGDDIRGTPSIHYVRDATEPQPEYEMYRRGLQTLLETVKTIAPV